MLGSSRKTLSILLYVYKMENMRMTELRALTRECELRGYSKLRKAELIAFLQDNENRARQQPMRAVQKPSSSMSWGLKQQTPTTELEPLTK